MAGVGRARAPGRPRAVADGDGSVRCRRGPCGTGAGDRGAPGFRPAGGTGGGRIARSAPARDRDGKAGPVPRVRCRGAIRWGGCSPGPGPRAAGGSAARLRAGSGLSVRAGTVGPAARGDRALSGFPRPRARRPAGGPHRPVRGRRIPARAGSGGRIVSSPAACPRRRLRRCPTWDLPRCIGYPPRRPRPRGRELPRSGGARGRPRWGPPGGQGRGDTGRWRRWSGAGAERRGPVEGSRPRDEPAPLRIRRDSGQLSRRGSRVRDARMERPGSLAAMKAVPGGGARNGAGPPPHHVSRSRERRSGASGRKRPSAKATCTGWWR